MSQAFPSSLFSLPLCILLPLLFPLPLLSLPTLSVLEYSTLSHCPTSQSVLYRLLIAIMKEDQGSGIRVHRKKTNKETILGMKNSTNVNS